MDTEDLAEGPLILHHVDVFTDRALAGNGLTVVLSDSALTAETMLAIAQELRQFETIFLFAVTDDGADARIFTPEEELDFAGTCVGLVERSALIDGSRVEEGDVVVGIPSAGVHANGFTLVRRVLEDEDYADEDLLAPTRLYLDDARRLRSRAHGLAHVTGGGILGNLERVLPDGLRAEIDWSSWQRPAVFEWLARHVAEDELRRVFNLGIGYLAVVPEPGDELVIGRVTSA